MFKVNKIRNLSEEIFEILRVIFTFAKKVFPYFIIFSLAGYLFSQPSENSLPIPNYKAGFLLATIMASILIAYNYGKQEGSSNQKEIDNLKNQHKSQEVIDAEIIKGPPGSS